MTRKAAIVSDGHVVDHPIENLVVKFTYKAYRDFIPVNASHRDVYNRKVNVKVFRVEVTETWTRSGQLLYSKQFNTVVSSRANDIAVLFREFKKCQSHSEIHEMVKKAKRDFRVSIEKDAINKLKSILGSEGKKYPPMIKSKRGRHEPRPEIELPWEKQAKR